MNGRVFPTLREAIHHTATRSGRSMKEIAAELDWSPTMLSFVTTLGEDNAKTFPLDNRLIRLMEFTGDISPLMTLADKLGYDLTPKRDQTAQIVEAFRSEVADLNRRMEQLLLNLEPTPKGKGKR